MEEGERGKQQLLNINPQLNTSQLGSVLFLLRLFHKRLNGLLIDTQKTARLYLARTNFWIHLRFTREKIAFVSSMPRSTSSSDNMFPSGEHELVCKVSRLDAFTDPRWLVEEGEHKKSACWMYETGSLCERGSCYNPRSKAFEHMRAGRTWQRGKVSNFIFFFCSQSNERCNSLVRASCSMWAGRNRERESQNRDTITNSFSQS